MRNVTFSWQRNSGLCLQGLHQNNPQNCRSHKGIYNLCLTFSLPLTVECQVIHKSNLSRKGRDNLVTEIGILKKLKHRFIVDLVDFHWDDKYIYIGKIRWRHNVDVDRHPSLSDGILRWGRLVFPHQTEKMLTR